MRILTFAASILALAMSAQAATGNWLSREFSKGWNVPGHGVEEFLNDECRPGGLDGIQMFTIQNGHGSPYNLHVYCRHDNSRESHYRVTMAVFPKAKFASVVNAALENPNMRIGPFRFGDEGEGDGLLLVEKVR
jgi:hypothetical protein